MSSEKFEKFLEAVNLKDYRQKYSRIKIVEMDLPKDIQAIMLLYKVYWDEKKFLSFEDFYKRYLGEKAEQLEKFRKRSTMCEDCFYRGLEARIYRTWAGLITQIHAGYVAESVFGKGAVSMSAGLDSQGADIRVEYRGYFLNYQVKKTSYSGVKSGRPLPRKGKLNGEAVDIKYEVPISLSDPRTQKGEFRKSYLRFLKDERTKSLKNGFVVFTPRVFEEKKRLLDRKSK
ncbi:MAG: TaqI family restriction endonuclease [Candidatus Yanofskybacteria bacterium]|nr:TaqI family restriction endonuclease [Candidatus Yanofskybacteria bacterium]